MGARLRFFMHSVAFFGGIGIGIPWLVRAVAVYSTEILFRTLVEVPGTLATMISVERHVKSVNEFHMNNIQR